jgi:hypothetical protein
MPAENPPTVNEQASREIQPKPRSPLSWFLSILAGAVLAVILIAAVVWLSAGVGLFHVITALRSGRTQINVDQPTVVRQIQKLQRLETVSYTMDKIISGEHSNPYLPKFLAGDRLLLVVHGEVIGGINLASLQPSDVLVHQNKIFLHLPLAELFSTRIDSAKTKVYSRDTGLFSSPDPDLESQVRVEAERQLQQSALQDGILQTATDNARATIRSMLQGFGFREVNVQ